MFSYHIALIGFMGTGKSTVASVLSRQFAMEMVEMDELIAFREGMSIPEIFEARGEAYFRDLETALLIELQGRKPLILSCGGGVPMREQNVAEMKKKGKVVLLTASPETILERVRKSHDRPLLEGKMNLEDISKMMESRLEKYQAAADITVSVDGKSPEEICGEIVEKLQREAAPVGKKEA